MTAPQNGKSASANDAIASKNDKTAPKNEKIRPKNEKTTPKNEKAASKNEKTALKNDKTALKIDIPHLRFRGPRPRSIFRASEREDRTQDRYSAPKIRRTTPRNDIPHLACFCLFPTQVASAEWTAEA